MAGSVAAGGNATAAAEANVAHDPDAMAAVLAAAWSQPPLLIGLDATHEATLGAAEVALCGEHRTPAAAFCDGPLRFYRDAIGGPTGETACHDLLAVLAVEWIRTSCGWRSSRWRSTPPAARHGARRWWTGAG